MVRLLQGDDLIIGAAQPGFGLYRRPWANAISRLFASSCALILSDTRHAMAWRSSGIAMTGLVTCRQRIVELHGSPNDAANGSSWPHRQRARKRNADRCGPYWSAPAGDPQDWRVDVRVGVHRLFGSGHVPEQRQARRGERRAASAVPPKRLGGQSAHSAR